MNVQASKNTSKYWLLAGAIALMLGLLLSLGTKAIYAGNIDIKDEANVLDGSQESNLRNQVNSLPYNVRVITTNNVNNQADFDNRVRSEVSSIGTGLIVAVSPKLRISAVEGRNIGLTSTEAQTVRSAGNSAFGSSNWAGGLSAMLDSSRSYASASSSSSASSSRSGGSGIGSIVGCLVIGLIALVALSFFGFGRRRQMVNNNNMGGPGFGGGYGQGYGSGYAPGYGGPGYGQGYGPGYNQGGGMGALGGGAIGAGLGGLVGYELGRNSAQNQGGFNNPGNVGNNGFDDSGVASGGFGDNSGGNSGGFGGDSGGFGGGSDIGSSGSFGAGGGGDWGGGGGGGGGDFGGGGGGGDSGSW